MNAYFVTVPITLTTEQKEAVARSGWRVAADLRADVASGAVPTTTIEVRQESPEQAVGDVSRLLGVSAEAARVEER